MGAKHMKFWALSRVNDQTYTSHILHKAPILGTKIFDSEGTKS